MKDPRTLPEYLKMNWNYITRPAYSVTEGNVRISVLAPRLVRIEEGSFTDRATQVVINRDLGSFEHTQEIIDGVLYIRTAGLTVSYAIGKPLDRDSFSIHIHTGNVDHVWHYGDQPRYNLKGTTQTLDRVNGECRLNDGVCSRDGYGLIDDSVSALFREDGWFEAREKGSDLYFFGYGHDYTACIQDYCRLTGAPSMLPAFALGNWWSRYHAYEQHEYLDLMDHFKAHDIPLSVGIVDMDWHITAREEQDYWDGWTGYTWNRTLFPDYKAFLKELHNRSLKTALNLHPAQGVRPYEVQYQDMAKAMGVDSEAGDTVPCDYLNPEFYKAYMEILHFPYEEDGVDFWWMDWQQGSDYRKLIGDKYYAPSDLDKMHPLWLMNHMHFMAARRNEHRPMIFSRFGGYGSQRYPIGFSGDSAASWDSLNFQPYFTSTASNIGYGWWSHDIGGHYKGYRDDELAVRWVQFGVFSPIFRLHSTFNIFAGKEPWNYDSRSEAIISSYMRLRHQLFPYLYTMNRRASNDLIPLIRPMYHVDPERFEAYEHNNEYWFGSEMIAAPVTVKSDPVSCLGQTDAWLPEGLWTDAFTGIVYHGDRTVSLHRRAEDMPVLLKAGAIVPLQDHAVQENKLGSAVNMTLWIAPGADNSFTLYEDDGETLRYQAGEYCTTCFDLNWGDVETTFEIHAAEGSTQLIPSERHYTLKLIGFAKGTSARLEDGTELDVSYSSIGHSTTVILPVVRTESNTKVILTNENGLISKNRDVRDVCIDILRRAQCTYQEKGMLLECIDKVTASLHEGKAYEDIYHLLTLEGFHDLLGEAMKELIREYAAFL